MKKMHIISIILCAVTAALCTAALSLSLSASSSISTYKLDFSTKSTYTNKATFYDYGNYGTANYDLSGGLHSFVTVDGVGCLKLEYCEKGTMSPYRCMPAFSKGLLGFTNYAPTNEYRYIRVTYMTDDIWANKLYIGNNGTGYSVCLEPNTKVSAGKFVRTNAVDIWEDDSTDSSGTKRLGLVNRFASNAHCTFNFSSRLKDTNFYIKEIAFFKSEADAYNYYGDEPRVYDIPHTALTYEMGGTGSVSYGVTSSGATYGTSFQNTEDGSLEIVYDEKTNSANIHYMAKIKFKHKAVLNANRKYARFIYSASIPEGVAGTEMRLYNDAGGSNLKITDVADTNGLFTITDPILIPDDLITRLVNGNHDSLIFTGSNKNCVFKLESVLFFETEELANSYEYKTGCYTVKTETNDISDFRIVISKNAPNTITEAAAFISQRIRYLTGVLPETVTDDVPAEGCEIIIGMTSRPESASVLSEAGLDMLNNPSPYVIKVTDTKIIINSYLPTHNLSGAKAFTQNFLYSGLTIIPETITLKYDKLIVNDPAEITKFPYWADVSNVSDPEVFYDDFSEDDGFFAEENGADDYHIANGVMTADTEDAALTYVHLFEKNVKLTADLKFENAGADADMGIMVRYNSEDAWVKAGYDFSEGVWYIDSRDGSDFYMIRCANAAANISEGTVYTLELVADGDYASLSVNGKVIFSDVILSHFSPGRIAVYSEDMKITVDNVEAVLLSGQGTVWKNVSHTKLPVDSYHEGGTVLEKDENTLAYMHHYSHYFESVDGGKTWQKSSQWIPVSGYYNVLRLNNGDLLRITNKAGYNLSQTSSDNGITWKDGANICQSPFRGDTTISAGAGNMNDKITQSAPNGAYPNRIFYSQNYETTTNPFDGKYVFCEFYYSDDNGATWIKSDTDSWEIEGNENETHFGECKLIECADGTIRMYNSWNRYGCIVYSDSKDGGKTFGPIQKMEDFRVSRSSMQLVRDVYAENNTTYYMVYVNAFDHTIDNAMPRCALTLCYSEDGKNWEILGESWRWESTYRKGAVINHVVDPFVQVTEDAVLIGSGFSDSLPKDTDGGASAYHHGQREHIYMIPKVSFSTSENFCKTYTSADNPVLGTNTQLVVIEARENTATYSYNGEKFYYSPKYHGYVGILPGSLDKEAIYNGIDLANTPSEVIESRGDVNGDNRITAGDAALLSSILHNPNSTIYTAKMRLEADVLGEHVTNESGKYQFVSVLDCTGILLRSIGLE